MATAAVTDNFLYMQHGKYHRRAFDGDRKHTGQRTVAASVMRSIQRSATSGSSEQAAVDDVNKILYRFYKKRK